MRPIQHGSTDQSVVVRIFDSTTFLPETGVAYDASGIAFWYRREGGSKATISLASLSALTDSHSDGGWYEIGDGWYRLDVPDAAFASGAAGVQIGGTVTDMIVFGPYIPLVAYDPQTVAVGANTTTPLNAAGVRTAIGMSSANLDTQLSDIPTVSEFEARTLAAADYFDPDNDTVANVTLVNFCTTNIDMRGTDGANTTTPPTVAAIADGVWDEDRADHATAGTFGEGWSLLLTRVSDTIANLCNTALAALHLDHLFATEYDPSNKPGAATALLNEIVEDDGGVSRFTANALEQAPSSDGGDATAANQTTMISLLQGGVSVSYSRPTWDGTTWTEPIVAGDSYIDNGTQDSRLKVTISNYSGRALADATISLNASRNGATFQLTADEVETVDATTFILDFAPTAADTAGYTKGGYVFNVVAEWTGPTEKTTLIREADKANLFVETRVDAG